VNEKEYRRMAEDLEYNLDLFKAEEILGEKPLKWVARMVFKSHGIAEAFKIDEKKLNEFLSNTEGTYAPENPYHNNVHAADVTWNLHYLLCTSGLNMTMTKLELFACIFSAIIHDCDHPGYNNNFLVATSHPLALAHNDRSPLENHHCSTGFSLALQSDLFSGMTKEEYKKFRNLVIFFVLGTDFGRNGEILQTIQQIENVHWPTNSPEDRKLIILLCLKCADIGHVSKTFDLHREWTGRITEEFFNQGDAELKNELAVSPGMDRKSVKVAESQTFFIGQIVLPMIRLFVSIFPSCECRLQQAEQNLKFWKNGGITKSCE